jgi:hypothetical protein
LTILSWYIIATNDKLAIKPNLTQEINCSYVWSWTHVMWECLRCGNLQANMDQNVTHKNIVDEGIPTFLRPSFVRAAFVISRRNSSRDGSLALSLET